MYCRVDGIASSCGEVCEELAKWTNKLTGEVYDVLCMILQDPRLQEMIHEWYIMCFVELILIQSIIAVELLDVCAINDNGDAI